MSFIQRLFGIKEKTEEERFTDFLYSKLFLNTPLYPDNNDYTYLNFYTSNSDVFTIINKITEPASTVPIYQYNEEGEEFSGRMLDLLNSPMAISAELNLWKLPFRFISFTATAL